MTTPEQLQAWKDAIGAVVEPGQVLAGKYRLEKLLGAGGMGVVLLAWHLHFEERVAVKLMLSQIGASQNARARFEREARAAFKIKSEHAARAIDLGFLDSGEPFIVMEFLEGQDLEQLLESRGPLPVSEAVDYVLQAGEAVAEAHVRKIVHRDLKPDNLFLTQGVDGGPCIKVVDFGISKEDVEGESTDGKDPSLLTKAGSTLGTPAYMAPEQWGAAQSVGPAADIWALGVILHQLVTGKLPFEATTLRELFTAVMSQPAVPLRTQRADVPVELEQAVLRCLAKSTQERFASVAELATAIGPLSSALGQESLARILRVQRAEGTAGFQTGGGTGAGPAAGAGHTSTPGGVFSTDPTVAGQPLAAASGAMAPGPTQQSWQGPSGERAPTSSGRNVMVIALAATALLLTIAGSVAYHFTRTASPEPGASSAPATESPILTSSGSATGEPTAAPETTVSDGPQPTAEATEAPSASATVTATTPAAPPPPRSDSNKPAPTRTTARPPTAVPTSKPSTDVFREM